MTEKELDTVDEEAAGRILQWHTGALSAFQMDLKDYWDALIFMREVVLNIKSQIADMMVIKSDGSVVIKDEIGSFFGKYNIIEFKSKGDKLNANTLIKALGYACNYVSSQGDMEDLAFNDVTVTLIRESKPEGLFKFLEQNGIKVEEAYNGIYYIKDGLTFPTQIVVGRELDREKHKWLGMTMDNVTEEDMRDALLYTNSVTEKKERTLLDSIMDLSMRANKEIVETLKGRKDMYEILRDLFEPEIEKIQHEADKAREETQQVRVEANEKVKQMKRDNIKLTVKSLRRFHLDDNAIISSLTDDFGLSRKDAMAYLS